MYTDREYLESKSALNAFTAVFSAAALLLLGAMVFGLVAGTQWLVYAAACVLAVGALFIWGNFGARLFCWNRFLKEMRIGLEREITGVVASIDEEEAVKEGIEFRGIRLFTGEDSDKAGGRLLYVDSTRFPLPAVVGQKVHCRIFGNYVKAITVLEE